MIEIKRYWVVGCPGCGQIQTTEIRKFFKKIFVCVYCRKRRKLKHKNSPGLTMKAFGQYDNPNDAVKLAQQLKRKILKKKQTIK